eukprot:3154428-Rhodomonas_salina.1
MRLLVVDSGVDAGGGRAARLHRVRPREGAARAPPPGPPPVEVSDPRLQQGSTSPLPLISHSI